jgi:hypothetical protein
MRGGRRIAGQGRFDVVAISDREWKSSNEEAPALVSVVFVVASFFRKYARPALAITL